MDISCQNKADRPVFKFFIAHKWTFDVFHYRIAYFRTVNLDNMSKFSHIRWSDLHTIFIFYVNFYAYTVLHKRFY